MSRSSTRTFSNDFNNSTNSLKNTFNNIKLNTIPKAEHKIKEKLDEMTPVLTNSQLKNLNAHTYSSAGSTLLDPMFQPYWKWLVEQMPIYLAPNLITVIGLIINIVTSTILILYSPNATESVSSFKHFDISLGRISFVLFELANKILVCLFDFNLTEFVYLS